MMLLETVLWEIMTLLDPPPQDLIQYYLYIREGILWPISVFV